MSIAHGRPCDSSSRDPLFFVRCYPRKTEGPSRSSQLTNRVAWLWDKANTTIILSRSLRGSAHERFFNCAAG